MDRLFTSTIPAIDLLPTSQRGLLPALLRGLSKFKLFESHSDAKNNLEACIERGACLSSYQFRSFMEECIRRSERPGSKNCHINLNTHKGPVLEPFESVHGVTMLL